MWAREFLDAFLRKDERHLAVAVSGEVLFDEHGEPTSPERMRLRMVEFHADMRPFNFTANPLTSEVEGDKATVEVALSWETSSLHGVQAAKTVGRAKLSLMRSPYGGWDVIRPSCRACCEKGQLDS